VKHRPASPRKYPPTAVPILFGSLLTLQKIQESWTGYWQHEERYKGPACVVFYFFFAFFYRTIREHKLEWRLDIELVREINSVFSSLGCLETKRAASFVTSNYRVLSTWQHYFCLALWHSCLNSMIPSDNGESNKKTRNRYGCIRSSVLFLLRNLIRAALLLRSLSSHCKGSVSCGNETRDLRVMRECIKWEEYTTERMRYCAARASLTKGAIYSWHKAQPSIRITYHTAAPFPNAILKGLDRRSPCTPFHNITLRQY